MSLYLMGHRADPFELRFRRVTISSSPEFGSWATYVLWNEEGPVDDAELTLPTSVFPGNEAPQWLDATLQGDSDYGPTMRDKSWLDRLQLASQSGDDRPGGGGK